MEFGAYNVQRVTSAAALGQPFVDPSLPRSRMLRITADQSEVGTPGGHFLLDA